MTSMTFVCGDEPAVDMSGDQFEVVGELCRRPLQIAESARGAQNVVLILHAGAYDIAHVQKALRSADVDPLGAQIYDTTDGVAPSQATIAGLVARADAFSGSTAENVKPVFPRKVTRRGLLQAPIPSYVAAPAIDHGMCAAADGCRACVDACPQDAYVWKKGRIRFDKDACLPCGRCVAVCPTEAIDNPAASAPMLASQVAAVVAQATEPVGIRFVCSRANLGTVNGWADVVVPCAGMVTGTRLLTTTLLGAGAATASSCTAGGCPVGLDTETTKALDFAQSALEAAGLDRSHVAMVAGDIPEPLQAAPISRPFTRDGDLETISALAALAPTPLLFDHGGATTGIAVIDAAACTLCAQCAQTCPTGAITAGYEGEIVSLSFDPAACTKCSQCLIACPEIERGAIKVEGRVDPAALIGGSYELHSGAVLVCSSCGKPIAPAPMMDRIGELLGEGFEGTMSYLSQRCMDCRGAS